MYPLTPTSLSLSGFGLLRVQRCQISEDEQGNFCEASLAPGIDICPAFVGKLFRVVTTVAASWRPFRF